jgi:hypothetical protein
MRSDIVPGNTFPDYQLLSRCTIITDSRPVVFNGVRDFTAISLGSPHETEFKVR